MSAWTVIAHTEVPSDQSTIVLSSIAASYTDLLIVLSLRSSRAAANNDYVAMKFNASTSNYSSRLLVGNGASVSSGTDVSFSAPRIIGDIPAATSTASTFGSMQIYIPNYAGSSAKSVSVDAVTENNGTTAFQQITAFLWNDTTAITDITFEALAAGTNDFKQYSSVTLYGITKGSSGGVTVS
jgi:hypothetical protein